MHHLSGVRGLRRSMHYLMFGLALVVSVAVIAVRATPSWALDKTDPDPTVLCPDADGCDGAGPDDPNIYTWDGPISGGPSDSDLQSQGYTCGWGSSNGAPYRLNAAEYGCWKGAQLYTCTPHSFLWVTWATDCVLKP